MGIRTTAKRSFWARRRISIILTAVVGVALLLEVAFVQPTTTTPTTLADAVPARLPAGRLTIFGHLVPVLRSLHALHPTDGNKHLHIAITLKMRDQEAFEAFLKAVNDPNSPSYHHYLSPAEISARFGEPQSDIDALVNYLRGQGFTDVSVAHDHLLIDANTTVATIERTFAVHIADFSFAGRTVFAPTNEPSLPSALGKMLLNISGLDDVARAHPIP